MLETFELKKHVMELRQGTLCLFLAISTPIERFNKKY